MSRFRKFAVLLALAAGPVALAAEPAPPSSPPAQVMVVGLFHFSNPGRDMFNLQVDDVLADGRQAEIERIADGLAAAEKGQEALVQAEQRRAELVEEGKQKAAEIIAQAQRRGDEIVEESKSSARSEGERLIHAAQAEIDRERTLAKENLKGEVAALAIAGAEQILMREVDRKAHDEILAQVSARL